MNEMKGQKQETNKNNFEKAMLKNCVLLERDDAGDKF